LNFFDGPFLFLGEDGGSFESTGDGAFALDGILDLAQDLV
jgi:hypothetical protein